MRKLYYLVIVYSFHSLVLAQSAPYGLEFYRLESTHPVVDTPERVVSATNLSKWRQRVEQLEAAQGPYAPGLVEVLLDVGVNQLKEGKHKDAESFFARALHVARLNDGLYSSSQLPILRQLIETHMQASEQSKADQHYAYLQRVYRHIYPALDERRLLATLQYMRWLRNVWLMGGDYKRLPRLLELYELGDRVLGQMAVEGWAPEGQELAFVAAHMKTLTILSRLDLAVMIEQDRPTISVSAGASGGALPYVDGQQIQWYQKKSFASGRQLLETLALKQRDPVERARAGVALGDWYTWNGRRVRAKKFYQQSWQILEQAGETGLLQTWFGEPWELPANRAYFRPRLHDRERGQVSVSYEVSRHGRARQIRIDTAPPLEGKRLIGLLRDTSFRPQMENGVVVPSGTLQRVYVLNY
jgi:hypothetical protein